MVTAPEQLDVTRREQRDEALHHLVKDSVERLSTQLSDGHTWEFLSLLRFYSRFWTYSVRNCLLIKLQCPDATRCAGRTLWNKQGYTIRKGQKAIWIWAPITRRETDPETGELLTLIAGFVPAPVFDFSQLKECDEKPLPMIVPTQPDDMAAEFRRLVNKIQAHGVDVTLQPLSTTHLGRSRPGTIVVSNRLDSRNQIFVMLHELTHQLWHHDGADDPDRDLRQVEFEAESVAYVVARAMGLEHPGARDYLLHWRATPELLHRSLVTIQHMVRRILILLEVTYDVPHTTEALLD